MAENPGKCFWSSTKMGYTSEQSGKKDKQVITSQYFGALYYDISVWCDALLEKDKL